VDLKGLFHVLNLPKDDRHAIEDSCFRIITLNACVMKGEFFVNGFSLCCWSFNDILSVAHLMELHTLCCYE
jgi:hypothetical protein